MMRVFTFIRDNDKGHMLGSGKKAILSFTRTVSLASKLTFLIVQYFTGRML